MNAGGAPATDPAGLGEGRDPSEPLGDRIALGGRSLREHTARGTIVNGAFQVGFITLALVKGLVVAALLSVADYGVWGILTISLLSFAWLRQVGVGDKFVQQSDVDQRTAFNRAFTLELIFAGLFLALCAVAIPLLAVVYGRAEIVAPGLVLALALAVGALQAPLWILYRRMQFARFRALQAIDPVVAFVVTIVLAAFGAGYWSLVVGAVAGAICGAAVALVSSPYAVRLDYERGTAREYASFSWPLVIAGASTLVISQGSIVAAEHELGLAAAGAITLAVTIAHYSDRVDEILTASLYPAICAVRDRTDLLLESFTKSNRLALIWAMPFGVGVSLFAAHLVHHVLGDEWEPAIGLLQVFGLTAAVGHIGFNWTAFYRARGETRPIAVWSVLSMVAFLAVALPLLISEGLTGFAAGIAAVTAVSLAVKAYYLARLFSARPVVVQAARAIAPSLPAAGAVLVLRSVDGDGAGAALGELAVYLAVTVCATFLLERRLLRETFAYLRGSSSSPTRAAAA